MRTKLCSSETRLTGLFVAISAAFLAVNANASSTVDSRENNAMFWDEVSTGTPLLNPAGGYPTTLSPEMIAAAFDEAQERAGEQGLRVVYLGTESSKLQMPTSSVLDAPFDPNGSQQIVIVDSANNDTDLLIKLLARGNFLVSVGNNPNEGAQTALSMLEDMSDADGKLSNSKAYYDANQPKFSVPTADDKVLEQQLTVQFYSPNGSRSYFTAQQDRVRAMTEALVWARDVAMTERLRSPVSKAASWADAGTLESNHDCGDGGGKMNLIVAFQKIASDGDSAKDYFSVSFQDQMVPRLRPGWVNWWHNADLVVWADVNQYVTSGKIQTYDPTTTSGITTAGVDLTAGYGSASLNRTWSYSISDIVVRDRGDISLQVLDWWHDINETKAVGKNTLLLKPGAAYSMAQGSNGKNIKIRFHGRWAYNGKDTALSNWCRPGWGN